MKNSSGYAIVGHKPVCDCGNSNVVLNEKHDAYYCASCDKWLDPACDDDACEFCKGRVEKPSQLSQ